MATMAIAFVVFTLARQMISDLNVAVDAVISRFLTQGPIGRRPRQRIKYCRVFRQ